MAKSAIIRKANAHMARYRATNVSMRIHMLISDIWYI
ncbi:MAG: hypothetical protein BWY13_00247 [Euryarchaeota archaeon ADurb.Bin190]|nr:MAG: hypothetical protein BWY13_00247 [Euryarchaeota archaeon ADurb.Bin190]